MDFVHFANLSSPEGEGFQPSLTGTINSYSFFPLKYNFLKALFILDISQGPSSAAIASPPANEVS